MAEPHELHVGADGSVSLIGRGLATVPDAAAKAAGPAVVSLDLADNAMRSFGFLAYLPSLRELVLDRNGVTEQVLGQTCPVVKTVDTLWLNNNALASLEDTMDVVCRCFPNLTYLSMLKNPACPNLYFSDGEAEAYQRYRLYAIHRMPCLEFLDATPVSQEELDEARRRGQFMRVARPAEAPAGSARPGKSRGRQRRAEVEEPEAPLAKPAAFLARAPRRYDGTHSEGNRFITDDEL